jgi:endoglucanase
MLRSSRLDWRQLLRGMRDRPSPRAAGAIAAGALAVIAVAALVASCSAPPPATPTGPATASPATPAASPTAVRQASGPTRVPPTRTATPKAIAPGYLHAVGSKLVDASGKEIVLTGINWFGMETGTYAPHGLWARNWEDMLDQIADLGYNAIRLPFSNQILDPNAQPLEGIDFEKNPDLRGLNGLQIMDKIVQGAGERGIKVLLDRHRPTTAAQSKLWYVDSVPEEQWIADWQLLARRYKDNDTVIGADLHNEPAGETTWGDGNPKTYWRLAAEKAGNAILDVNPNWLIVVEGIEKFRSASGQEDWYWMGGSLQGALDAPVRLSHPDKLVYSAHDYGPGVFSQGWFQDKTFPKNLPAIWDAHWGYLVKQNIAPVIIGEFGGRSVGSDTEGVWQWALIDYLKQNHISYTYWSLNPNSGDTGGVLQDDWVTVDQAKQKMLATYQWPQLPIANADAVDTSVAVSPRKAPLPAQRVKVLFRTERTQPQTSQLELDVQVVNLTDTRVPLEGVALSYWFAAPGLSASSQSVSVDWSSVDQGQLKLALEPDSRAGQTFRLGVSFGKEAGMIQAHGNAELKLRVKRADEGTYDQASAFSFVPGNSFADAPHIALYFWGDRIWGQEPG